MPQFRKRPVVIEAVKFDPDNLRAVLDFTKYAATPSDEAPSGQRTGRYQYLHITTLEGILKATAGDWIIKGVAGEFYPCKPEIFDATYELVGAAELEAEVCRALHGLTPYQLRVVEEVKELSGRSEKLELFLRSATFKSADALERRRLVKQAKLMRSLAAVLQERVDNFPVLR